MNCREYAAQHDFKVVGRLKRMPDHFDPFRGKLYRWFMDEAENEYHMSEVDGKWSCFCIMAVDGECI